MNEIIKEPTDLKPALSQEAEQVLDVAMHGGRHNFNEDGGVNPVIICYRRLESGTQIEVVGVPMKDDEDKDMVAQLLYQARKRREAVAFVTESWMAQLETEPKDAKTARQNWEEAMAKYGRVSRMPNRKEIVNIMIYDGIRQVMIAADIQRSGPKPTLGDWKVAMDSSDGMMAEGRFV